MGGILLRSGEVFKKLRKQRGISQETLTKGICARSTLGSFENKGSHLSVQLCGKLLDRLNIQPDVYFSLLSDDFDSKKKDFQLLKKEMRQDNLEEVSKLNTQFKMKYESTKDFYWFNLYFHSERFIAQSEEIFSYEEFNRTHKKDIALIKKFLYSIDNWGHFEFAVFTNSVWCFDLEYVLLIKERLKKSYHAATESQRNVYAVFLLNTGYYFLEFGHFDWIKNIKDEVYELSSYENIHWKLTASFQFLIAEELLNGEETFEKDVQSLINIYKQIGDKDHYNNLIEYRERLLKKHEIKA